MEIPGSIIDQVLELAVKIQQIPAPTFREQPRAEFILKTFNAQGAPQARMDPCGNVYVKIPGRSMQPMVVVSAHLDTVFPLSTDLTVQRIGSRIYGPGIGDNSISLACLFGLYWLFSCDRRYQGELLQPRGDLLLVANVGEEGLGDLVGMKAVVDSLGSKPAAYIVLEGISLGHIYHRGLGVKRFRLKVQTAGGHAWIDYGRPSAIHELAELIVQVNRIRLPAGSRSSVNVGMVSGGTSVNTIAAEASCELDLRSETPSGLEFLVREVKSLIEHANRAVSTQVNVSAELIGDRPAGELAVDHRLVKLARQGYIQHGVRPKMIIGSTDANIPLSRGLPAICLGLTTGGGAHTKDEFLDIAPLGMGLGIVADLILSVP